MWIRQPNPFLTGIMMGVALISISATLIIILLFVGAIRNLLFYMGLLITFLGIIFIFGWMIFISNVLKYIRPYGHCPACGYRLAWDAAYRVWFCHHCSKRFESEKYNP
jgi:hypothetical protein